LLVRLLVKNFGIIEEINWFPGAGLNFLTGETGAGKSLVIDAVSALLSGRLDESVIRHGSVEAKIEAEFDISSEWDLCKFLNEQGVESEDSILLFTLAQKRGGRPVIRLNGSAATRSLAIEVGRRLVDIHGQSQHLSLLNRSSHLEFLDSYAGTLSLRHEFGQIVQTLTGLRREFTDISEKEADSARRQDFLSFQYREIERAGLVEGEDIQLEEERRILASAEKLKALAYEAETLLDGEDCDSRATNSLSEAASVLEKISIIDNRLRAQAEVVRNALFGVGEAAREVRAYISHIEADPMRLEEIENRIGLIKDLKRKYGNSVSEILCFAKKTEQDLSALQDLGDRKSLIIREIEINNKQLAVLAAGLNERRLAAGICLEKAVNSELAELGMESARFRVSITQKESSDGVFFPDGRTVDFNATGADQVEFIISTNPGEPFQPLEKIASTGELSRFTLAIKTSLAAADKIPVLVFDEIDIGVGGRSGDIIGRKLSKIARSHQVICVTHLPQIACYGAHHFTARKVFDGTRAETILSEISGDELVFELAAMLSGHQTLAASDSARELLAGAASYALTLEERD
jgi:DNA repair protein RecN (Recombination protein N)